MAASTNEKQLEANRKQPASSIVCESEEMDGVSFKHGLVTIATLNSLEYFDDLRLPTDRVGCELDEMIIIQQFKHAVLLHAIEMGSREVITEKDLFPANSGKGDLSLVKYFVTYQKMKAGRKPREIEKVIVCTNARIQVAKKYMNDPRKLPSDHALYFKTAKRICRRFNDDIIPELSENIMTYIMENPKEKFFYNENDVKEFLVHFELIEYPSGPRLEKIIQQKISQSRFCKYSDYEKATTVILTKIRRRIKLCTQDGDDSFIPAMFHNIYPAMLEQCNIFFKASDWPFTGGNKQVVHVVPQKDDFLYVMKVYRELQHENVLFLNLNKDFNIHNGILDKFDTPRYTHLVVIHSKKSTGSTQEICSKIKRALSRKTEKRLVLIADKNDEIAKQFKSRNGSYVMVREDIAFMDFDKGTRRRFLKKHIIFQGRRVQLKEVFSVSTEDDINYLLNFEMLTKLARGEKIEIGEEVKPSNDYYIPRIFDRNNDTVSEEEIVRLKGTPETRVILISGSAGMGKSSLLRNITASIKDNNPHLWVVLVDLSSYSKHLRKLKQNGSNWHITLTDLFGAKADTKFKSTFERKLFSAAEKVLLIDSIHEIEHTYEHIVFSILKDCKKTSSFTKIFITTRPYSSEKLERLFNVKSWTLSPLSKEDQTGFLENWSKKKLQLRNHLEKEKSEDLLNITGGTPLYTIMLAEIFSGAPNKCDELKELLEKKNHKLVLPIDVDLFEVFTEKKCQGCLVELQKQAIKTIFGKYRLDIFNNYKHNQKKTLKADSPKLNFFHRTIAEYFAAKSVMEELGNQSTKFKRFLVEELLYWREYNGVRAFVESFLRRNPLPPSSPKIDQFFSLYTERNFLHVLAREGCAATLRYMFDYINFNSANDELTQCWSFTPKMKQSGFKFVDIPNEIGYTPLQEAAKGAHLDVIKLLIQWGANIDITDEFNRTPLHTAARDGRLDVVKYLVKNGADVNSKDKDGNTPLLDAARECHSDIVRYLVKNRKEKGAHMLEKGKDDTVDINDQDEFGATVLHFYAFSNNLEMIEFLLKQKRIDVNKKMFGNCTALHAAVYLANLDMVTLLTEHGADVNCVATTFPLICGYLTRGRSHLDKWEAAMKMRMRDFMPLHLATRSGNLDIVKVLIKNGANVNMRARDGDRWKSVIDMANESDNLKVVKYLKSIINASLVGLDTGHYKTAPGSNRVDMLNCSPDKSNIVNQIFNDKVNWWKFSVAAKVDAEIIKCSINSDLYDRTSTSYLDRT